LGLSFWLATVCPVFAGISSGVYGSTGTSVRARTFTKTEKDNRENQLFCGLRVERGLALRAPWVSLAAEDVLARRKGFKSGFPGDLGSRDEQRSDISRVMNHVQKS
jgi:hypothetical protein